MEKKFCINCKYMMAFVVIGSKDTPIPPPECRHPKSRKTNEPNLVTGVVPEDYHTCEFMRDPFRGSPEETYSDGSKMSDYACTKDGAWFEQRPVAPPPPAPPEPRMITEGWTTKLRWC